MIRCYVAFFNSFFDTININFRMMKKTAVTVIQTVQTGIDNYKDLKKTKVFEDNATLLEIKQWAKEAMNLKKVEVEDISLGSLDFSDVDA